MIDTDAFYKGLKKAGYDLITGVPDSLLKELVNSFEYFYKKSTLFQLTRVQQ